MKKNLGELLSKFNIFSEERWGGWVVTLAPLSSEEVVQNVISKIECEELESQLKKFSLDK